MRPSPRPFEDVVLPAKPLLPREIVFAKITGEPTAGSYTWDGVLDNAGESGTAVELNGATGIFTNIRVILFRAEGQWRFFYPVEDC